MEKFLKQEGLIHTLERTPLEEPFAVGPEGENEAEAVERNAKFAKRLEEDDNAVTHFWYALPVEVMETVMHHAYAKQVMAALAEKFQSRDAIAMIGLRGELYSLKQKHYASLRQLINTHDSLVRQIEMAGEQIPREERINTLLVAIPDGFKHVTGALAVLRKT